MQLIIDFPNGVSAKEIAQTLRFQAGVLEGMDKKKAASRENTDLPNGVDHGEALDASDAVITPKSKPRGRPKKVAAPEPEESLNDDDDDDAPEAADDEFDIDNETLNEEVAAAAAAAPVITKTDVIASFKAFAIARGRDKAGRILTKYGVKSVHDLDPKSYAKVIKELV